jgi:hypothetical protein
VGQCGAHIHNRIGVSAGARFRTFTLLPGHDVVDHHVGKLVGGGVRSRVDLDDIRRRRQRAAGRLARRLAATTRSQHKRRPDRNGNQAGSGRTQTHFDSLAATVAQVSSVHRTFRNGLDPEVAMSETARMGRLAHRWC